MKNFKNKREEKLYAKAVRSQGKKIIAADEE